MRQNVFHELFVFFEVDFRLVLELFHHVRQNLHFFVNVVVNRDFRVLFFIIHRFENVQNAVRGQLAANALFNFLLQVVLALARPRLPG